LSFVSQRIFLQATSVACRIVHRRRLTEEAHRSRGSCRQSRAKLVGAHGEVRGVADDLNGKAMLLLQIVDELLDQVINHLECG
jgi:hypothetical protein